MYISMLVVVVVPLILNALQCNWCLLYSEVTFTVVDNQLTKDMERIKQYMHVQHVYRQLPRGRCPDHHTVLWGRNVSAYSTKDSDQAWYQILNFIEEAKIACYWKVV